MASTSNEKDQPLFKAIRAADLEQVRQALKDGANPDSTHPDGYTALVLAASLGKLEVTQELLAAGARVNSPRDPVYQYEREWGPFIAAIVNERPEMVRQLLTAGADAKCYYDVGNRPESLVPEAAAAILDELNVSCTSLYVAIGFGNQSTVRALLKAGASPDDGDGSVTPLELAVREQDIELVEMLLGAGADVNQDMEDYERAVMTAAWNGNLAIVKLLHEAGAEVDTWSQGESALSFAASGGHPEVYEYLLPYASEEQREHATRAMLEEGIRNRRDSSE